MIVNADCRPAMRKLAEDSVTAIVTDPPYELGFMGRGWDQAGVAFDPATWKEALRVLKPGGTLLAFGGTRTYHRLTCAIEDAGFEIRDCLMWLYGSGFPKSHDISKAIDKAVLTADAERQLAGNAKLWEGYGTALKPAYEPIVVAMKPVVGTFAVNALTHGVGGLNIDGCRVQSGPSPSVERRKHAAPAESVGLTGWTTPARPESYNDQRAGEQLGRWPANVMLSHHPECVPTGTKRVKTGTFIGRHRDGSAIGNKILGARRKSTVNAGYAEKDGRETVEAWDCHSDCPIERLDSQTGPRGGGDKRGKCSGKRRGGFADIGSESGDGRPCGQTYADSGGPSRFFYCPKANRKERGEGNTHPTVKPLALMQYLVKLVTYPEHNLILDPFAGSGTTLLACQTLGIPFIGIEQNADYCEIINRRLN